MVGESNQNVCLIQKDASSSEEFELSEFEISRFDCTINRNIVSIETTGLLVRFSCFASNKLRKLNSGDM